MRAIPLLVIFFICGCSAMSSAHQHYKNLGNPTEYLFSAGAPRVQEIIHQMEGKSIDQLETVYRNSVANETKIGVQPVYSRNYWIGKQETDQEAYPPEAGKIGEIEAFFIVRITPKGSQTLVIVETESFEQQVGRHYEISPHFHKTRTMEKVKSDTYYEYVFLKRLGELLGEPNMPEIKAPVRTP